MELVWTLKRNIFLTVADGSRHLTSIKPLGLKYRLSSVDWEEMEVAAKTSPTVALNLFMEEIIPLLEKHVPVKQARKNSHEKMDRKRRILWRRMSKIKRKSSLPPPFTS